MVFHEGKGELVVTRKEVGSNDGVEGCRLGTETTIAEGDGSEALTEGLLDLLLGEIAFGSDEDHDMLLRGKERLDRGTLIAFAMGNETETFEGGRLLHKIVEGERLDKGEVGFERLFHGADGDFFQPIDIDGGAL